MAADDKGAQYVATIREPGRVKVPRHICESLGLKAGDIVEVTVRKVGEART